MSAKKIILSLLFAVTAYLSLARLDEPTLWNDEAHVFMFGESFLRTGHATAWDGRNLCGADRNGAGINLDYRNVMPQLDFGVAALAISLLGYSVWSAHILFALAGIASISLLYFWIKLELPEPVEARLYAFATIGLSATFLLYIRTCRYYSIATLMLLVCLISYSKYFRTKNWRWLGLFAVAATLLYYSSALICGAFLFTLGIRHLFFYLNKCTKQDHLFFCGAGLLFLILITPYLLSCTLPYIALAKADEVASGATSIPWIDSRLTLLWWNIKEINMTAAMPWTILAGVILFCFKSTDLKQKKIKTKLPPSLPERAVLKEWLCLGCFYVIGISLLSPQPVQLTRIADIRYMAPILPLFAAITGILLSAIHRKSIYAAVITLAMLLTSTLPSVWPAGWTFRWLLPDFIKEIHTPYPTSCSETAQYLRGHAAQDDTVFILPEFMQVPIQFEIGDLIKIRGVLNRRTHLPVAEINRFDPTLFIDQVFPKWIVSCGMQPELGDAVKFLSRSHTENNRTLSYHYEIAAVLPVYWNESQRPELPWHSFGPNRNFNPKSEAVYIIKRVSTSN